MREQRAVENVKFSKINVGALYSNKYDNTCNRQQRGQQND